MKKLIIAEKPSVARDIASSLGKLSKNGDEFENDELVISHAVGHLVELVMPEDIDPKHKHWALANLPIIPDDFKLRPIENSKSRFQQLKKLFLRKDITEIYNACDAGREGELIFNYIYELIGSKKPVKRMWMLSMTRDAIRKAFQEPRDQEEMAGLNAAAHCRSESDWLIGINGTRALTKRIFGNRRSTKKRPEKATVGRVQTPTLAMLVQREKAIEAFSPTTYWTIEGQFGLHLGQYAGVYQKPDFKKNDNPHDRADRIWDRNEAEKILTATDGVTEGKVTEETKDSQSQAPRLFDLTSLQREANNRFGYSAGKTLSVAQRLYESHKVITYPRTDSKALPEDYLDNCREAMQAMQGNLADLAQYPLREGLSKNAKNRRIFNNKQISDHFAIIPTAEAPKKLNNDESRIYDLIVRRFLAIFYPNAIYQVTTRWTEVAGHSFKTEGKVLKSAGYLEVYGKTPGSAQGEGELPAISDDDGNPSQAKVIEVSLLEDQTRPPARFSEATLLSAMEGAGKMVDDDELAEAMKEKGLGTPATRASIIEHLIRESFVERNGKELIPTGKAITLLDFLTAMKVDWLTSPDLTGEWEYKLKQMEEGKLTRESFMEGIREATKDIVEKVKTFDGVEGEELKEILSPTDNLPMLETLKTYESQDGKVKIYKNILNRMLKHDELAELLKNSRVGPLEGFVSAAKKRFNAELVLEKDKEPWEARFNFPDNGNEDVEETTIGPCNRLGGTMLETATNWICRFDDDREDIKIGKTILLQPIDKDNFIKLMEDGKTGLMEKFISKRTRRPFKAFLLLKENGGIGFEFPPRAPSKKTAKKAAKKTSKKKVASRKKVTSDED